MVDSGCGPRPYDLVTSEKWIEWLKNADFVVVEEPPSNDEVLEEEAAAETETHVPYEIVFADETSGISITATALLGGLDEVLDEILAARAKILGLE